MFLSSFVCLQNTDFDRSRAFVKNDTLYFRIFVFSRMDCQINRGLLIKQLLKKVGLSLKIVLHFVYSLNNATSIYTGTQQRFALGLWAEGLNTVFVVNLLELWSSTFRFSFKVFSP